MSILTIKQWTFASYGFLVYLLLANLLIAALAKFRPHSKTHHPAPHEIVTI